jgi:hypothetical protein
LKVDGLEVWAYEQAYLWRQRWGIAKNGGGLVFRNGTTRTRNGTQPHEGRYVWRWGVKKSENVE